MSTVTGLMSTSRFGGYILCWAVGFGVTLAISKLAQKVYRAVRSQITTCAKVGLSTLSFIAGVLSVVSLCSFLIDRDIAALPTPLPPNEALTQINDLFSKGMAWYCWGAAGSIIGSFLV